MTTRLSGLILLIMTCVVSTRAQELTRVDLKSKITQVQPMTGIVVWEDNEAVDSAPIQLEYAYLRYDQVIRGQGRYDWSDLESLLNRIAGRKHQAVLRWHDTYVGKPTGVPAYIKALPDYRETTALSEGKKTGFPDWSHQAWQQCVLDFFSEFARRYDQDPRIAFVQVGFGLWAEYHIYDGPMKLGSTFPSKAYQSRFLKHLATQFKQTPWMISVDAAGDQTPITEEDAILALPFGLFDDSFNHKQHAKENEPNWDSLDRERWKRAPAGGEFSFFESKDQRLALAPQGPHGIPFETHAAQFHISFMIGDDQPRFQPSNRIREAGLATGYRFHVDRLMTSQQTSEVTISNRGIAPIYYDAFPAINGTRASASLKGLLPGQAKTFTVSQGGEQVVLTIECDRLVPGQKIEFEAG